MFVSLAECSGFGINSLGALFTNGPIDTTGQGSYIVNYTPQISIQNIIIDTMNWTLVKGSFVANGGEDHLTIGCFVPDDSVQFFTIGGWDSIEAVYYIDDVSLYLCETITQTNQLTIYNAFTPNADGVNDIFHIKGNNIKELHAKIINRWGQVLYKWDPAGGGASPNAGWDGKYNGMDVAAGAYFWVVMVVYEDGSMEERKGSLELIR